ncbi:MAG: 4Fe-4S binding protein [Bauldia sp.]|nr:4Fe-4S binding protein [Bauldia sp.]
MAAFVAAVPAQAARDEVKPPLEERATPEMRTAFFPTADRFEFVADDRTPVIKAFQGETEIGYIFSAWDIVRPPSYSPRPFDAIIGMDTAGVITGIELISFYDSYLVGFPERIARIKNFLSVHIGYDAVPGNAAFPLPPDFVAGVTISARSIRSGIMDAARIVFRANSNLPPITEPTLDVDGFGVRSWAELVASGAIVHREVTYGDVRALFAAQGVTAPVTEVPLGAASSVVASDRFVCRFDNDRDCTVEPQEIHPDGEIYTDFYVSLGTAGMIGRNALTSDRYARYFSPQPTGTNMLLLFSNGPYNFRGISYYDTDRGEIFDRFKLVQGDLEIVFNADQHQLIGAIGGERPRLPDASAYFIPADSGFDPLQPFEVVLLVHGTDQAGVEHTVEVPVTYQTPSDVVLLPYVEPPEEWVQAWSQQRGDVIILGIMLTVLTAIFIFQKQLTQRRKLHNWVRIGFLTFTLVWLGWTAGGQLSIEHVTNYLRIPLDGLDLNFILREPLIIIISVYVLLSLILIGRGVFCGWLCPFGALQELTARVGRFLHLPQWTPPDWLHRWMWLPKYGTAALIVVVVFAVPEAFHIAGEIEPFNTAIGSVFSRPAPYVTYAVLLVVMSLFTERFFCRFLCPLGGFLAVADRLHIFTFLKRRAECGTSCHLCERSCPVRAIEKDGKIIMAECFQCLDCQVEYYDDHRCPPLSKQRKQKERAAKKAAVPTTGIPPMGMPVPAMARVAVSPAMEPARGADR